MSRREAPNGLSGGHARGQSKSPRHSDSHGLGSGRGPRSSWQSFDKPLRPGTPNAVLASLRATQIVTLKPVLPAELLATILDYLPVSDLLTCARASKRLQEMVYDDTRWVQRLRAMGVWNEVEARQRYEDSMKRKLEAHRPKDPDGIGVHVSSPRARPHAASITIFDAAVEEDRYRKSLDQPAQPASHPHPHPPAGNRPRLASNAADGFDDVTLPSSRKRKSHSPELALVVLRRVRSIRGQARQEYGKIHGCLAPFYYDLADPQDQTEPLVFRTYEDPEQQARILADLRVFARCDTAQGVDDRLQALENTTSTFESAILHDFQEAYIAQDVDRMRRFAHVLVTLNGGAAAIDFFISNHPYMLNPKQLGNPLDCVEGVAHGHADLNPPRRFFEKLASMLVSQSTVIAQVFPPGVGVLLPFVNRVCDMIISDYVTALFNEAHRINIETYLKAVSGVFTQALQFAITIKPPKNSTPELAAEIEKSVTRCFEPHIYLYLAEELEFFKNKSYEEVTAWEKQLSDQEAETESFFMSNINRQAAKRDFLSSFKKVVMMPVNVLPAFPSAGRATPTPIEVPSEQSTRPGTPALEGNIPGNRASVLLREAPTTELAAKTAIMNSRLESIKSLFSIEVALNLIHYAKASIERAAIFARADKDFSDKTKVQCETIFVTLLDILGRRHIQNGFDKAVGHLSSYNPHDVKELRGQMGRNNGNSSSSVGVEPLVTFLELVNVGDLIQQMVDVFYSQELVATKLTDRDDFLNPAVKEKKRFEQMLDERVAAGMSKGIDVLMDEVEFMCATLQQTTDFNPAGTAAGGANGGLIDIGPTETAVRIVETISSHTNMLVGSTDKNMLDVFNQEVGLRLFGVLCKHIKRQRISVDGAIKLISDINAYSTFITSLRQKQLLPYFSALRELAQLYLIDCNPPSSSSSIANNNNSTTTTTSSIAKRFSAAAASSLSTTYPAFSPSSLSAPMRAANAKELATIIADNDRYGGIFRAEEVYEFAERRADWYTVKGDVERAMYGVGCCVM